MNRIRKKEAEAIGDILKNMLVSSGLGMSHNTRRIYKAWDDASGAGNYTLKRFFRDGKLYITLSSSVIRGQLSVRKTFLLEKVNAVLADDPMMIRNDTYPQVVTELILK